MIDKLKKKFYCWRHGHDYIYCGDDYTILYKCKVCGKPISNREMWNDNDTLEITSNKKED